LPNGNGEDNRFQDMSAHHDDQSKGERFP